MTWLNEGRHAAEFLVSEANGYRSREQGEVDTGQTLVPGQVIQKTVAGKLTAFTADVDTSGALVTQACGIALYGGTAGEKIAYVDSDSEVTLAALTYPEETTVGNEEANTIASLALLGIKTR